MHEREYQARLIKKLKRLFPGCVVLKNDANYRPGIPDLIVLYGERWAMLEVKKGPDEARQPNQAYYVEQLDYMSFAAVIFPENEEDILHALQYAFRSRR